MSDSEGEPQGSDLERAIDEVYQAPLETFVAARTALAASLRTQKRTADAARVKALVKPTATAWAVNQAWFRDRAAFDALLDSAARERDAHKAFAETRATDVRAAAAERERAAAVVVEAALRALGRTPSADARFRIAGTIDALASSGVPADQTLGRLTRDLQATGLGALGGWAAAAAAADAGQAPAPRPTVVVRNPEPAPPTRAERQARERAERLAQAEARLATATEAAGRAAVVHADATEALDRARQESDAAAQAIIDAEQRLEAARAAAADRRRTLADATRQASEAELQRARATRELTRAEADVKESKDGARG
ncbi:MAG: hypothetical protein R2712_04860 [Vicinamibacterales bacterium]